MKKDTLMTPEEVAEALKLNRMTVYRLIKNGKLKAFKFSRKAIRIYTSDLDKFIKEGELNKAE